MTKTIERKAIKRKMETIAECPFDSNCETMIGGKQIVPCGYLRDVIEDAEKRLTVVCSFDDSDR